jgi:hypothetical protein
MLSLNVSLGIQSSFFPPGSPREICMHCWVYTTLIRCFLLKVNKVKAESKVFGVLMFQLGTGIELSTAKSLI